jgi:adenylate kinase
MIKMADYLFGQKVDYITLIGPPGAGKGTHGETLQELFPDKFYHFSTGEMFRKEAEKNKNMGKLLETPKLVPDEETMQKFYNALKEDAALKLYNPGRHILVLDGIPRTVNQAKLIEEHFNLLTAVYIWVPDHEAVSRMLNRKDGRTQNDKPEKCQGRLDEYFLKTYPLLKYYPEDMILKIDNFQPFIKAHEDLVEGLEKIIKIKN